MELESGSLSSNQAGHYSENPDPLHLGKMQASPVFGRGHSEPKRDLRVKLFSAPYGASAQS